VSAPSAPGPSAPTSTAAWLETLSGHPPVVEARRLLAAEGLVSLHGLSGPPRLLVPLLVAGPPLLVVVSAERLVERATEDLRTLAQEAGVTGAVLALPAPGPAPFRGLPRHPEASLRRAAAVHAARRGRLGVLVASPAGLLRPILAPPLFETRVISIETGEELTPEMLLEALDEGGYRREDPVSAPGQAARRGGILDVFPPDRDTPVRIEFLGDTVESLRTFDPETQRTTGTLDRLEVLPLSDAFAPRSVLDALRRLLPERFAGLSELPGFLERLDRGLAGEELPDLIPLVPGATVPPWDVLPGWAVAVLDPEAVAAEADAFLERAQEERARREDRLALAVEEALVPAAALEERIALAPAVHVREVDLEARGLHVPSRPPRRYAGDLRALAADLRSSTGRTVLFLGTPGRAERLKDVLREDGIALGEGTPIEVRLGVLGTGFELPEVPLRVLADGDVFPEEVHLHRRRGRGARTFLSDFRDLKVGDLVVHQDHGIGRFEGLETIEVGGTWSEPGIRREFMVLVYQGGDKLKVPVESFDRVQKYASAEGARPVTDKLGSGSWEKTKRRVKKAMREMAAELLRLYAERKARPGHAFTGEGPWQREFEESFEYEETTDQAAAIVDVMGDMSHESPMDRLICGDVGYGKTEVAMRAAMRAVLDAKQVAVLAPTTILAFQHWKTFRKRFAPFPVRVEMVSRFRSPREIKAVLEDTAAGKVDVLIGTHRLLSKDVRFRDLGLLVIDEEQRFGVAAKEKLKHLRTIVDCLTLSATPIPRTLQMGLAGIRDMSVIETPPKDRLAIQTSIVKFSTDVMTTAIRQELARDGQVYVVHNRVESIYSLANLIQKLVPEARVAVAHGQMPESELEKAMLAFVEGRADVLVATTIIENGLDIPRANTMIINRADRYGLAQLYQLRGRVGRSERRASAYLMVPPDTVLSEIARKRLAAMREFSELGAGFRVAALDLELRGAGNLLGGEQSGHIEAVGLDLYVKLLEQTILELKGQPVRDSPRTVLNLRVDLRVPEDYVPEVHQRMALYKRVSQVRDAAEVARLAEEIRDRYGPFPPEVEGLLGYAALRLRAEALGIVQADLGTGALHLRLAEDTPLAGPALARAVRVWPGASLSPAGVLRAPLPPGETAMPSLAAVLEALEAVLERAPAAGL
jgi:transcription-repair coupling factor (superfamily II helicase)